MANDDKMTHKDHDMSGMDHSQMTHQEMDHSKMDHAHMSHDEMAKMDHHGMAHSKMTHEMAGMDHSQMSGMDHSHMDHGDMDMGGHDMMMHGGQMMHMGNLKQKFWVSVVLSLPVLLLAPIMGLNRPVFNFNSIIQDWVVVLFDTIIFFYGGKVFLQGAKAELQSKEPAMMTLIAMGITVSYVYSLYAFIANNFLHPQTMVMDFSFELATLILIMLLGHWIEMNAVMGAGDALQKMAALLPKTAHRVTADGRTEDVPVSQLQVGESFQVRAGESIPADGTITAGTSTVNESLVTGESAAVAKKSGDKVIGGATNNDGTLTVAITGTGQSGYLAQVMQLVQSAQQAKSNAESKADTVAKYLFYAALSVGIIAFFAWLPQGLDTAFARMVTVFIIACPHALGLAIPLVVARSTAIGAQNGLLIRNRQAIEASTQISHVLLDKTGTLTEGKFTVNALVPAGDTDKDTLLRRLAALESNSTHPLAQAILSAAKAAKVDFTPAKNTQNLPGVGIKGTIDGIEYTIVNAKYLTAQHIAFDEQVSDEWAGKGNSVSFLLQGETVQGLVAEGDTIKAGAKHLITGLQKRGITPVMLTGDNPKAAAHVANLLGLTEFHGGLLPDDKQKMVGQYQADGHHVIMVGDGVNDAPSLAKADIGIAIGAGTDVAIDSADVVLVKSDPQDILHFLDLARITNRKMVQNLWWGAGYNILAIPLAAGILAFAGIILDPAVGAILMSLSTVIVALNAMGLTAAKIKE
ncbi:copper-translocating P-type ATPase [Schleiferilactobacillus harbinensis]|uniref:heavy metal translocating P-type ATPase n=1 Tax=Schleiferilactobacillus harbinensis TaxID=304207 RepID=UPI0021A5B753|nr:copper-translocating P-type ATPase [Schleiferilactobacillus harbinensis]MCT2909266.1 copper-translocating P-type ATPase [Schleiferilactobacillus harbinensis]